VKVAFIGLGAMGYPMAGRLAGSFDTQVWNRNTEVAERHSAEFGSTVVAFEQVAAADVILSCVTTSGVVREIVDRIAPALRPGTIWVDCTSGELALSREIAAGLAGSGVDYLDAPVSGMVHGARSGTLSILVGGPTEVLARVRPVLDVLGSAVIHVGPVGCGHLAKAANNSLLATSMWAAAEALGIMQAHGITTEVALDAINASSGRSNVTEHFLPESVLPDIARSPFELGTMTKDITNLVRAARGDRAVPLLSGVEALFAQLTADLGWASAAKETYRAIQLGAPA
jgi:3-hydroxyisobutyrate dehydrogenase